MARIAVYQRSEELEQLREPWQQLQEHSIGSTVYTSFEWNYSWWQAFGKGGEMYVVACWEGEQLRPPPHALVVAVQEAGVGNLGQRPHSASGHARCARPPARL